MKLQTFDSEIFNSLGDIDVLNSTLLTAEDHIKIRNNALKIINKHALGDSLALFVLHKHFSIQGDEVLFVKSSKDCFLKTNVIKLKESVNTFRPHTIMFRGNNVFPVEYSNSDSENEIDFALKNKDFLNEFNNFLKTNNVQNYYGLTTTRRYFLNRENIESSLVEYSDSVLRESRLEESNEPVKSGFIHTVYFVSNQTTAGCRSQPIGCWPGFGNNPKHETRYQHFRT